MADTFTKAIEGHRAFNRIAGPDKQAMNRLQAIADAGRARMGEARWAELQAEWEAMP